MLQEGSLKLRAIIAPRAAAAALFDKSRFPYAPGQWFIPAFVQLNTEGAQINKPSSSGVKFLRLIRDQHFCPAGEIDTARLKNIKKKKKNPQCFWQT